MRIRRQAVASVLFVYLMVSPRAAQVHVDLSAPPGGDGVSWATAFQTIQAGIDAAPGGGGVVWVADGTYAETIDLAPNVKVYGGFSGLGGAEETALEERDWVVNLTTIDGQELSHVVTMDGTFGARVDGFTITHGVAREGAIPQGGGGVRVVDCPGGVIIANCSITENGTASGTGIGGAGLLWSNSQGIVRDTALFSNTVGSPGGDGGGAWVDGDGLLMFGCVIAANFADRNGGGLWANGGLYSNCIVSGNVTRFEGGGLVAQGDREGTFLNCLFNGNLAGLRAGGVLADAENLALIGCNIAGNTSGGAIGGTVLLQPALFESVIFSDNTAPEIMEAADDADGVFNACLFNQPEGALYRDAREGDPDFGTFLHLAEEINGLTNIDGVLNRENIDGDPRFEMDGPRGISGQWDSVEVQGLRTVLRDNRGPFAGTDLKHEMVNPNSDQRFQALILANTSTTLDVLGDVTGFVAPGDPYRVINHRLRAGSAAIDAGVLDNVAQADFDGNARPRDVPLQGWDGPGQGPDIGAFESQTPVGLYPTSIDFGEVAFGATPETVTLEIANAKDFFLIFASNALAIGGEHPQAYTITGDTGQGSLFIREIREVGITFVPPSLGFWEATLEIRVLDDESLILVPISGRTIELATSSSTWAIYR